MNITPADWTGMSPSDWMNMSPSDWMDRTFSGWWNRSPGDLLETSPSEWLTAMFGPGTPLGMLRPARPPERTDTGGYARSGEREHHRHRHHHHHRYHDERCCRRCGEDPCECYCCIGDVDFAVYARLGEQRVIPILVENERRREKHITLELSDWTTRGGKAAPVKTVLLEPKTFPLEPCGEKKVTLVVGIGGDGAKHGTEGEKKESSEGSAESERKGLPDVDECLVAFADLRLVGCDHRPIRIAVAILPRDCDPYKVICGCTCC